jgi:5-methylcytosine-specific restriction protein B
MNTADRSIALVDAAMRRRFAFVSMYADEPPVSGVLRSWLAANQLPGDAADLLDLLNARILDRDFHIGPSYLMKKWIHDEDSGLDDVWQTDLLPLLEEHHAGENVDVEARYGLVALRREMQNE